MGGFTRNPQRPLDKTRGRSAPTGAAPPRTAPSLALASSSPPQLNLRLFYVISHPLPQGTQAQYLSPTPLSSPSLLLAVPGCTGSLPPPRPPLRLERPAASIDTAASAPRIRLFSFLSFLLTPPSSPSGSPASKRGQPRNQRWRLLQGQLETALKRLNFFSSNLYWN